MKVYYSIIFIVVLIISGCKTISTTSEGHNDEVTKMKSRNYSVSVGETVDIKLTSNPTTGYKWHWSNMESVTVVESSGYKYIKDKPIQHGSGGIEVWTFIGVKPGKETIILEYCRSWDKENPVRIKEVVIKVK